MTQPKGITGRCIWGVDFLNLKFLNQMEVQETIHKQLEGGVKGGQAGGQAGDQTGGQTGGQAVTLTNRQREVLKLIVDNPKISRKDLAEKLGINESAVQKHTDALKKKKLIERKGDTTGHWIIKTW